MLSELCWCNLNPKHHNPKPCNLKARPKYQFMQSVNNITFVKSCNVDEQWKRELSDAISSPTELLSLLELDSQLSERILKSPGFKLRVPRHYVNKMKTGDRHDPLLRQVLPILDENITSGLTDPVGDLQAMPVPGLHHKYFGRALMITTGACAIHCRYCFRRHYPYQNANTKHENLSSALAYLNEHKEIKEVILSGGDPFVLDDLKIANIIHSLESIQHVKWLRIHTRLPVVLPSRITDNLLGLFSNSRFSITFVIHANHANELGEDEAEVFKKIKHHGITLLNQSVLLNGVNNEAGTLITLSEKLYEYGVLPYYLHCLDPVQGALHFDVNTSDAINLIRVMREKLPGYLVPKLVKEEQGKASKTEIFSI